jgi:phage shock protein B
VDHDVIGFFTALFSIFAIFIALPWIVLHHLSRRRDNAAKAVGEPAVNASLMALADRLEKRLDAIESLLDHEVPGWRRNMDRRVA